MAEWQQSIERWLERGNELKAAVEFTAAATGFLPELVEKDFWCSVVLGKLFATGDCPLIFKGGTLLSKAYVAFNRLSEDLDFTLPTETCSTRGQRSKGSKEIAALVERAASGLLVLGEGGWESFNVSTQHQAKLLYPSVFGGEGTIKLEVGQREMPMCATSPAGLATLLRDPLFDEEAVPPITATSLSLQEAYAEKVRAALTRKDPAPRDLFDLDYAVEREVLDWNEEGFLKLAARKVAGEPDGDWVAEERIEAFRRSLESELRPVLRAETFEGFNFLRAANTLKNVAAAVKKHLPPR